jgi:xylose isomerase
MSRPVFIGDNEYFPGIDAIPFEGPGSDNPLAFKAYDAKRVVAGKTMEAHLRYAVCLWHTFHGTGNDPFGPCTRHYTWNKAAKPLDAARQRLDAAFEFFTKLGVPT